MPKKKNLKFKPTIYKFTFYACHENGRVADKTEKEVNLREELEESLWNIPAMNLLAPVSIQTMALEEGDTDAK